MNQQQRDRVLTIIDNDAEIRDRYINKGGHFCIIGGFLDGAGVNVQAVDQSPKNGDRIGRGWTAEHLPKLAEMFGLSQYDLEMMQTINDEESFRKERQISLRDYINRRPLED